MILRLLTPLAVIALSSCSSTALKEADSIFHDGDMAENTALEYTKVELASGSKITKVKVAKDQQSLAGKALLLRGLPGIIDAGGDALTGTVDQVSDLIE